MMQTRVLARLGRLMQQQQQGSAAAQAAAVGWGSAALAASATAWPSQQRPTACLLGMEQQQQQWRHKHTVPMVLLQDHPKLGSAGALVRVKAGYARHSLFPQKIADYAVPGVLRRMREQGLLLEDDADSAGSGRRRRGLPGSRAPGGQLEGRGSGGEAEELSDIVKLLTSFTVVARRRYRWKTEEQSMIGEVTAKGLSNLVRSQLHIDLPPKLVMLDNPIKDFGEFSVPLNLVGPDGQQVEVKVNVIKVRHA